MKRCAEKQTEDTRQNYGIIRRTSTLVVLHILFTAILNANKKFMYPYIRA